MKCSSQSRLEQDKCVKGTRPCLRTYNTVFSIVRSGRGVCGDFSRPVGGSVHEDLLGGEDFASVR